MKRIRLLCHLIRGLVLAATVYRRADPARRQRMVQTWSRQLLAYCGIRLQIHGDATVLDAGAMVVSNHVSWLDIYVINAWRPTPFVAKAEIAKWPVIGFLAESIGTVFIERTRRSDARRIVSHLAGILQQQGLICVFPEGTTTAGLTVLPFHANILEAAVAAQAPIQPLSLLYASAATGRQSLAPAYVGDLSLAETLKQVLTGAPIVAHLFVGVPIVGMTERRTAAAVSHQAVASNLAHLQAIVAPPSAAEIAEVDRRLAARPTPVREAAKH